MRLFIAIWPPPAIAAAASRIIPITVPGLRRVRPELLHVTLAFLGEVPDARLDEVGRVAAAAAAGSASFAVSLELVGSFPPRRGEAAVWLGAGDGGPALASLAGRVRAGLEAAGLEPDRKPFQAHITLGRIRADAPPAERRAIAAALAEARFPPLRFRVDAVDVVQSVLSPHGPRYSSLRQVALREAGR